MTAGLDLFAEKFKDYTGEYVIIGGTATSLLLEEQGLSLMRVTKDIDMVVIVESLSAAFGKAFWAFIKDGGYKVFERSDGMPQFFRFRNPRSAEYPLMIELFARKQGGFKTDFKGTIIPIHLSDDLSSLSAILLNDEYYNLLKGGKTIVGGVSILSALGLIPFKAKAWLDLSARKADGQKVNSTDISKHQNDIFRLAQLLNGTEKLDLAEPIITDMANFLNAMDEKEIRMRDIGVGGDKAEIIKILRAVYLNA